MMKLWQVYSSDTGVNWREESGWTVAAETYAEAYATAKSTQERGGGHGHLSVERIYEPAAEGDQC